MKKNLKEELIEEIKPKLRYLGCYNYVDKDSEIDDLLLNMLSKYEDHRNTEGV